MGQTGIQEGLLVGRRRRRGVPPWLQGCLVALVVALSFGAITATIYWWSLRALTTEIHSGLLRTASIARRSIDLAEHDKLRSPEDRGTPAYDAQAQPLRDIVASDPQVAFVWTVIERAGKIYFVLDGTLPPAPGEPWPEDAVGVMEEYENPPDDVLTVLREGREIVTEPYTDEWGSFISAFVPIKDRTGDTVAVFGIDLSVDTYQHRLQPIRNGTFAAIAIGAIIAVLMGLGVWFNRKTDRNARDLARQLRTVNALLAVSRALGGSVSLGDLLPVIVKQTRAVMASEYSELFLLDARSGKLSRSGSGSDQPRLAPAGIVGRALASGKPQSIVDASRDPDFDPRFDQLGPAPTRSLIALPIRDAAGVVLGVLAATDKSGEPAFDDDDQILLSALGSQVVTAIDRARLTQIFVEKQKLDQALKLAASIQMSMLSRSFPTPGEGAVDIHACIVPAKEVGGDFYDFFWLDRSHLAFLVADVSGKGMPAALYMAKAKTLVKAHAGLAADPQRILERANNELSVDNDAGMFVTLFLGILDCDSGELRYTNAGHNQPYRMRPGMAPEKLPPPDDIALGVMEDMPFHCHVLQLLPGESLFLYTDGVNEAMDLHNQQFDYHRLEAVLARPWPSVAAVDDAVVEAVQAFAFGAEPSDDLTALTLRWRG